MARIFDVIEYASEKKDEIVRRFPEDGPGDFRIGSQVIVRESQRAIFFRSGRALDVFGPGQHTIATANVPKLIDLIGKAFNDRSPFTAEVYFVCMREFPDRKWGTSQPIVVETPGMGFGVQLMTGFGTYGFQVADAQQFVTQIVGAQGVYRTTDIEERLKSMMLSKLQDVMTTTSFKTVPELLSMTEELGAAVRAKTQDDFQALGLTLKRFYQPAPLRQLCRGTARPGFAQRGDVHPTPGGGRHARSGAQSQRRCRLDGWNWGWYEHWQRYDAGSQRSTGSRRSTSSRQTSRGSCAGYSQPG